MMNDGPRISQFNCPVHHIDENLLVSQGAPNQRDGMKRMLAFLDDQATHGPVVLVAHNGFSFDCKFLHHTLKRVHLALPTNVSHFVDTLQLAREADFRPSPPNKKLGTLNHRVTGRDITNAHDALADARAVATVLFQLPELRVAVVRRSCRSNAQVVEEGAVVRDGRHGLQRQRHQQPAPRRHDLATRFCFWRCSRSSAITSPLRPQLRTASARRPLHTCLCYGTSAYAASCAAV